MIKTFFSPWPQNSRARLPQDSQKPLNFFTELVADEVEVSLAPERVDDEPDHLVERDASLDHGAGEVQVGHALKRSKRFYYRGNALFFTQIFCPFFH